MKVDWKKVAASPGYKSLKAAYIDSVQDSEKFSRKHNRNAMRVKKEYLDRFNWIINRAKHYAHIQGVTLDIILNQLEEKRQYGWFNYYDNYNQPKVYAPTSRKRAGINAIRKAEKSSRWGHHKKFSKHRVCNEIMRLDRLRVKDSKRKPRWHKRMKEFRKKCGI